MISRKNIDLSIIVPVFNCEQYLSRCLDSILIQSYKNYEIILIDDGSSDDSGKICDEYSKKDKRIKVIHKENAGVSKARNDGITNSIGRYICFLDSDDYISGNYFDEVFAILEKYKDVELINFGFYSDVDDLKFNNLSSDLIKYDEKYYSNIEEIRNDFVNLWDNSMLYNIWNKIYLREIINKNNICFPDYFWGEDVKFNRAYLDSISSMYNSKKCFYHYIREREGAVTKKYKPEIFDIRKEEFKEFNDYFDKWNISKDDYYEYSCRRFIERLLGCIENVYCSDMKLSSRYKSVKNLIKDPITRESLKYAKPKSGKVKIMLIPIRLNLVVITMLMGRMFNIVKTKCPSLFNKLKNRR